MNYILFDDDTRLSLLPFTFTRPIAEIRFGILTIREKWEKYLNASASFKTEDYLSKKFPIKTSSASENTWINGSICPNKTLLKEIKSLTVGSRLVSGNALIAVNTGKDKILLNSVSEKYRKVLYMEGCLR